MARDAHGTGDREQDPGGPIEPEGTFAGVPYDWRKPTAKRVKARWWNAQDPRFFTPKSFGWGYDVNAYWLVHPVRFVRNRRS